MEHYIDGTHIGCWILWYEYDVAICRERRYRIRDIHYDNGVIGRIRDVRVRTQKNRIKKANKLLAFFFLTSRVFLNHL